MEKEKNIIYMANLIFEGEYLNEKRWNGKIYDNNNIYELKDGTGYINKYNNFEGYLEFQGEYANGIKNGKGKEYNCDGELIFEGEYVNGIKNGKGKEYNQNGELIFEGEYLDGIKNGKGKEYIFGKVYFEGEYSDGIKSGNVQLICEKE